MFRFDNLKTNILYCLHGENADENHYRSKSELMNIMLYLSNYNNLLKTFGDEHPFNKTTTYGKDIIKHFLSFKNHKTIQLLNEVVNGRFGKYNNTFCYDATICLAMQLKDDFTYDKLNRYPFHTRLCRDSLDYSCPTKGIVAELIVSKKLRSKETGQMLLKKMEDYFKSINCEFVQIDVFAYNEIAKNFYHKNNYEERMLTLFKKLN